MQPAVSIITVYYNAPEEILKLAASMKAKLKQLEYEWIVVDNNSQIDLSSQLDCTYVRNDSNVGFGAGCNLGAKHARADALFFVNPDCLFIEDCVTPLKAALQNSAIAGPQVINPDGTIQLSFGPFLSILSEMKQRALQRSEKSERVQSWLQNQPPQYPDFISGCAMMVRSPEFQKLGGFDDKFFLYHEDVDLCKRVRNSGDRVIYVPEAKIQHAKGTSAALEKQSVNQEYRKSQIYYYKKHHGFIQNSLLRAYLGLKGKMPAE